ncbi:hypothetical protein ACFL7D_05050 [candidate division KSB1 bacterium]
MAENICKFSIEDGKIVVKGLRSLKRICNYIPDKTVLMYKGVELAEDLKDNKGAVLYAKESKISVLEIRKLTTLQENYEPNFNFNVTLKPAPLLISHFRKEINIKMEKLIEHRGKFKVYSKLFGPITNDIRKLINDALSDDIFALHVYKMKFAAENASNKNSIPFFNHMLSVALFSYAICRQDGLADMIKFSDSDRVNLVKAAFLFGIGALSNVDTLIGLQVDNREEGFDEENKNSTSLLTNLELEQDTKDAIEFINEYPFKVYDIIPMAEKSTWIANIIIVSHLYSQEETGLFGVKSKVKDIVDQLNVMAVDTKLNTHVVQNFTFGLRLTDIFDFYQEIETLQAMCDKSAATPYPMTGFVSPTIFLCKKNVKECQHLETGTKAVTLMKNIGDLSPGQYSRCALVSPKLQKFYDDHYSSIKDDNVENIKENA